MFKAAFAFIWICSILFFVAFILSSILTLAILIRSNIHLLSLPSVLFFTYLHRFVNLHIEINIIWPVDSVFCAIFL